MVVICNDCVSCDTCISCNDFSPFFSICEKNFFLVIFFVNVRSHHPTHPTEKKIAYCINAK